MLKIKEVIIGITQCGVPQGSVLGPLLFIIYINDSHNAPNYSDIHHFADDTDLLYSSKFLKDNNEKINFDLKNIGSEQRKFP